MGQFLARATTAEAGQDPIQVSWTCKVLAQGIGVAAGLLSICLGLWASITFNAHCLGAGVLMIFFGTFLIILEAPCFFPCVKQIDQFKSFSDNRPHWQKAVLYCVLGIIPFAMCQGVSTFFGGGGIFVCGAFYGMFALGKKADRSTMLASAGGPPPQQLNNADGMRNDLVSPNRQPTSGYP